MNLYQVDIFRTRTYKDIYNEPCDCIYCKNFRVAFPSYAPKAYDFLKTIGLSPEMLWKLWKRRMKRECITIVFFSHWAER